MSSAEAPSGLTATPYVYSDNSEFVVLSQRPPTRQEAYRYNPLSIIAAAFGLGWLGMIVNGQAGKGVMVAALCVLWGGCAYLSASQSPVMLLFTAISGIGGYLIALVDVYCIASKLKQSKQVDPWEWF